MTDSDWKDLRSQGYRYCSIFEGRSIVARYCLRRRTGVADRRAEERRDRLKTFA